MWWFFVNYVCFMLWPLKALGPEETMGLARRYEITGKAFCCVTLRVLPLLVVGLRIVL